MTQTDLHVCDAAVAFIHEKLGDVTDDCPVDVDNRRTEEAAERWKCLASRHREMFSSQTEPLAAKVR